MTFPAASNVPPIPLASLTALEPKARISSLFVSGRGVIAGLFLLPFGEDVVECAESPINSPARPRVAATSTKLLDSERADATA